MEVKELITIEKGKYNELVNAKSALQEQTRRFLKLKEEYRDLEKRHYILLLNNKERVDSLVKLGDYVGYEGMDTLLHG